MYSYVNRLTFFHSLFVPCFFSLGFGCYFQSVSIPTMCLQFAVWAFVDIRLYWIWFHVVLLSVWCGVVGWWVVGWLVGYECSIFGGEKGRRQIAEQSLVNWNLHRFLHFDLFWGNRWSMKLHPCEWGY